MKLDIKLLLYGSTLILVGMYVILKAHDGEPLFFQTWSIYFTFTWIAFTGFHTTYIGRTSLNILNGHIGWKKNLTIVILYTTFCVVTSYLFARLDIISLLYKLQS